MARQTLQFAKNGAHVTYCDVAASNLAVIRRLAKALGFDDRVHTILIEDFDKFEMSLNKHAADNPAFMPLDVITAFGSMHHAPREKIVTEANVLLKHLKPGGTWLQLAYPITRWLGGGRKHTPTFTYGWGGDNGKKLAPWTEWYSPGKFMSTHRPNGHRFYEKWCGIIGRNPHNPAFIWMEFTYRGKEEKRQGQAGWRFFGR